ncbi:MAG: hypothetical protein JNM17_38145 [Archangium sp.]|nr:hypothetical protein [Archangium sp.]
MTALLLSLVLCATPGERLAEVRKLYGELDYGQALKRAQALTAAADVSGDALIEALALEGTLLAITGDVTDAEPPFRRLLRLAPQFELPPKTAPKIIAAFRKVQAEERTLAAEAERARRSRVMSRLKLVDELPTRGKGGVPLDFRVRLFDPEGAVMRVSVPFRREGEASWSVLALQRDELGQWAAALPGDFTASERGFTLQYRLETIDAEGAPLLVVGDVGAPLTANIAAGQRPRPVPRWVPLTGIAGSAVSAAGFATFFTAFRVSQDHAQAQARIGLEDFQAAQLAREGQTFSDWAIGFAIASGVLAVVTVVTALFADW